MTERSREMYSVARSGHWAVMRWIVSHTGWTFGNRENCFPPCEGECGEGSHESLVLVVRDPFNCLASTVQATEFNVRLALQTAWSRIPIWKALARSSCGVKVLFNWWASSRVYRDSVARSLGFENVDRTVSEVDYLGHGRSYWQLGERSAVNLHLTDRWRRALEKSWVKEYLELLRDRELWELSRSVLDYAPEELEERVFSGSVA